MKKSRWQVVLCLFKSIGNILNELEVNLKRALYPKHWNLIDSKVFSEHVIPQESAEFKEISAIFYKTMKNFIINKLIRIQNKAVISEFIGAIPKGEGGKIANADSRKLLFHGTKIIQPKQMYYKHNSEFNRDYINQLLAKGGFDFVENASVAHQNCYRIDDTKSQLLLVDAYVKKDGDNRQDAYTLYNEMCIYPLYLIEYQSY